MKPNCEKTMYEAILCFSYSILESDKMKLKYSFCILDEIFHYIFTDIFIVH